LWVSRGIFSFFSANLSQLAGIQPVTTTPGAFVDLDSPFGTEEVAAKFQTFTTWAFPLASWINDHPFVTPEPKKWLTRGLILLVDLLQLKSVKPNTAAPVLTDIDKELSDLHLR